MDKHEKAAKAIVKEYRSIPSVKSVMAYGSYARGDYSESSDIDLVILLDSEKFCRSDASKLIRCVRAVQRRYGVRLAPDFILDSEVELFNRGILLDGRALSDAHVYRKEGKILLGEDFRHLFVLPDSATPVGETQFYIIEEHFKRWLLRNLDSKVPHWFVSWSIVSAVNAMGSTRVDYGEESFVELERLLSNVRDLPAYRKFKSARKTRDVLAADEFLKMLKTLERAVALSRGVRS